MADFPSPHEVEQLLAGTSVPGELDAGASRIGQLLSAMHSPAMPAASANDHRDQHEHEAVAAIVEVIRESPQPIAAHRRSRVLTRRMSAKAAAVAATLGALLAGGTAAAATGSLPVPAQSAVSSALAHVGVSVPKPNPHANRHATNKPHRGAKPHDETTDGDRVADRSEATGPDATGSAKHGLCRAWAATPTPNDHSGKRDSVAFTNLQAAADAAGMSVADFCKDVTPTTPSDETAEAKPSKPSTAGRQPRASKPEKDRPSTGDAQSDNPGAGESADGTSHAPDALPAR